jgi:hypothetical protein
MKTKLIILTLLAAGAALAATMTIEVPDQDVPRILEAYGSINNLGRNATASEVQYAIQRWLRDSTLDYERRKDMAQFSPPPLNFSPTPAPSPTAFGRAAAQKAAPTATPKQKKQ